MLFWKVIMDKAKAIKILKLLRKKTPHPKSELNYSSPFELLIAVILSAQATDISVNKATANLFPLANTPKRIYQLEERGLKKQIKSIGLYNTKAKNIIKTCKLLIENYSSKIPNTHKELLKLPGVGRKTANIIMNIVYGEPTIAVDTHIFRVSNRTRLAPGKNPMQVEEKLLTIIPKPQHHDAHHLLLLHGRYVCTARNPKCKECVINKLCEYEKKDLELSGKK